MLSEHEPCRSVLSSLLVMLLAPKTHIVLFQETLFNVQLAIAIFYNFLYSNCILEYRKL